MVITKTKGETFQHSLTADADSVTAYFRGPAAEGTNVGTLDVVATFDEVWTVEFSTGNLQPGEWAFEIWGTLDGVTSLLEAGGLTIKPSIQDEAAGVDRRSHAAKIVEMIEAYLEGTASSFVRKYKINNRDLERYSIGELLQLLNRYKAILARENAKARGESPFGKKIVYRF